MRASSFDFRRNAAGEITRADPRYAENGGTRVHSVGGWGIGDVLCLAAGLTLGLTPWQVARLLAGDDPTIIAII